MKNIILLVIITLSFSSCFQSLYRIQSNNNWNPAQIDSIKNSKQNIVVHFSNDVKRLAQPVYSVNSISGNLAEYKSLKKSDRAPHPIWDNRYVYKRADKYELFTDRHIYLKNNYSGQQTITITDSNFLTSQVYLHDKKATRGSYVLSALVITGVFVGFAYGLSTASFSLE